LSAFFGSVRVFFINKKNISPYYPLIPLPPSGDKGDKGGEELKIKKHSDNEKERYFKQ